MYIEVRDMKVILILCLITVSVFLLNFIKMRKDLTESLRWSLMTLSVCIIFSLPVGKWETWYLEDTEQIQAKKVYVTPCAHHIEKGGQATYMTPAYTSILSMCLNEDEHLVQYCPKCHTREDAVKQYIMQR